MNTNINNLEIIDLTLPDSSSSTSSSPLLEHSIPSTISAPTPSNGITSNFAKYTTHDNKYCT